MEKKIIGILGGMGPLATADLFQKIVLNTKAGCDQEHARVMIDSNTNIPDRTAALLQGGADPVPAMTESAKKLEQMGADFLIMPCNTAHNYHGAVQEAVSIPVLHMIRLTCEELAAQGVQKAALLATNGCARSGIYQRTAEQFGLPLLVPEDGDQEVINDLVYKGVKAGCMDYDTAAACAVVEKLLSQGAQAVILGCTELPLAWQLYRLERYPSFDPTLILAKAAIKAAGYETL